MDLYQEIILDHYKNPRNVGTLSNHQHIFSCSEANVGCGDEFVVTLQLDEVNQKVMDIKWQGQGCAISTAAMSLLSEHVKGKVQSEVEAINQQTLLELLGLDEITPAREKCLMLGLRAILRVLHEQKTV